jgi:hypothetical protein
MQQDYVSAPLHADQTTDWNRTNLEIKEIKQTQIRESERSGRVRRSYSSKELVINDFSQNSRK